MSEGTKLSQADLVKMFGTSMPIEAVNLLFDGPGDMTIGEMKDKLREIAERREQRPVVQAIQTDREAAAEIGERFCRWQPEQVHKTLEGRGDEFPIVQAFARHRLAAQSGTKER